jgi:molybdopterin converting factor small subunit
MPKVSLELWMWLGNELPEDFSSLSEMRSQLEASVKNGTTVRMFLYRLVLRYPHLGQKVFSREKQILYPNIVALLNDRVIRDSDLYAKILKEGDKITILPIYAGG